MKITQLTIKNYQFSIVVFLFLSIAGIYSFLTMPRTENPEMSAPGVSVFVVYPGANPIDLEQLVATPIEDVLNELDDIKKIETKIKDGIATVSVEFYYGVDPDEKYDQVLQQINVIKPDLPEDIYHLEVFKWSVSDVAIMQLALVSETLEYKELQEKAEKLKNSLKKIQGIKKVNISAYPKQDVRVSLDMEKMAILKIGIEDIENAIKSNNANIPGGSVDVGTRSFNINTSGAYKDLSELENTLVKSYEGKLIYLKDIAVISVCYEDQRYFASFNGRKAVFITLQPKEGQNVFETEKDLNAVISAFKEELTQKADLEIVFNQAEEVNERIKGFMDNLYQGMVLVGIVILLALGLKSSFIVILAIPFSILIGLWIVDFSGYGLEQISIAGLVVALGLLVDNSIVVIENINRYVDRGMKPQKAAVNAVAEIGWPVISATVTTLLAFVPIILMPDKTGEFIRSLPVTIIATLSVSLLLALTFTPLLASKMFKTTESVEDERKNNKKSLIKKVLDFLVEGPYRATLNFVLGHKILTLSVTFVLFVFSLFGFGLVGMSFFPKAEKPQFMILINTAEGSSLDLTHSIVKKIENHLDSLDLVEYYASNTGHGNPRLYYNTFERNYSKNLGEIFVKLKQYDVEEFDAFISELRSCYSNYPDANISIKEFEQGPPMSAAIMIYISGDNMDVLKSASADVEQMLSKQNGAINIENELTKSRTDLHININKDKAALYGVPVHLIDKTIRTAISGLIVSEYHDKDGKDMDIVMRLPTDSKISLKDLDKIYVKSMIGEMIPLRQLAYVEFKKAPGLISRYNMQRTAIVTADLAKGFNLDDVLKPVMKELEKYQFPKNYSYQIRGEYEGRQESFGGMKKAVFIALISIFAVLVMQFKSFSQPLIIYTAILLAVIGAVWTLFFAGYSFSFTAFIGLTSLVGIVVNNSIILVDFANQQLKRGKSVLEAVKLSGETRFLPIVLTTLTTVGGLLPLTLKGGTLWAPMGWTIIGGLIVSTFLTLIVVPVLYLVFTRDSYN